MNILFLTHLYLPALGGVQRSVHNLAGELTRRGHRVIVASHGDAPYRYRTVAPAPVLPLIVPDPFDPRPSKAVQRAFLDAANLLALIALCIWKRIDLVHCHLINADTRYAAALQRLLGVKLVITLRGSELHAWIAHKQHRRAYVQRMIESADAVTALSQSQMDHAIALAPGIAPDSLVITNPADPHAIRRQAAAGHGPDAPASYILCSGRLEYPKRVDVLIDAYHGLIEESPDFAHDLVIAGDGELRADLEERARSGPGASRIHFSGARQYAESLALIREAAMLVLSSESEGCPNVILEAMSLETPVIVSDIRPLLELVTQGVNGEVFRSGDRASLRRAVLDLSESAEKRSQYAAAGLNYLASRHRFDLIGDAYEALYARLKSGPVSNQRE